MSTIRVKKDKGYFVASNKPFNNKDLSWEARGVLAYLLSKPNNWVVRNKDLYRQSKAGRYKVDRILGELKDNGYLERTIYKKADGTFEWESTIHETPITIARLSNDGLPNVGKPRDIGVPTDSISTESLINKTKKPNSAFGLQASSVEDETKHEKKRKAKGKTARPQAILQIEDILGRTFDESLWSTIQDKITLPIDAVRLYQTFAFHLAEGYSPRDADDWIDEYATNAHYHREHNKEVFKYLPDEPVNMPYHAAVRAMAEVIGYNPDWILHGAIVNAMKAAGGIDMPRLKQCYADWCGKGYNKYNLEGWYFERYVQERPYAGIGE